MRIVGLRTSELVVRDGWPRAGGSRTAWKVLHPTAPAVISDDDVELAVRAKPEHPAIVVAAERLPFISLKCMELDQVPIEPQSMAIPDKTVDPVAEQGHIGQIGAVHAGIGLRPVQVNPRIVWKSRMEGDSQQPPF